MSKKILIPEGLIDPNQTTVIEIPYDVQKMETVVAKPYFEPSGDAAAISRPLPYGEVPDYYYYDVYDRQYAPYPAHEPNLNCIHEEVIQCEDLSGNGLDDDIYMDYGSGGKPKQLNTCFVNPTYKTQPPASEYVDAECSRSKPGSDGSLVTKDIMSILDNMDKQEFKNLHKNLLDFQRARRKLFLQTTSLNNLDDISTNLLETFK